MIIFWHAPNAMKMIRQNDCRIYLKRVFLFDMNKCLSQKCDIFCVTKNWFPVFSNLCKKIATSALVGSSVLHSSLLEILYVFDPCWVTKLVELASNPTYDSTRRICRSG